MSALKKKLDSLTDRFHPTLTVVAGANSGQSASTKKPRAGFLLLVTALVLAIIGLSAYRYIKKSKSAAAQNAVASVTPDQAYQSALTLYQTGRFSEAAAGFEKLATQFPQETTLLINLAVAYKKAANLTAAETTLLKAIEQDPSSPTAHNNLGVTLLDLKKLNEAISAFDQAIQLNPSYADPYFNRAIAFEFTQQWAKAVHSYYLYSKLGKLDPAIKQKLRERMRLLRSLARNQAAERRGFGLAQ